MYSELLYITANALSTQTLYSLSNLYKFSKISKPKFFSYNTLLAENFVI